MNNKKIILAYLIGKTPPLVFGTWEGFEEFLTRHETRSKYIDEFRRFYALAKSENFKRPLPSIFQSSFDCVQVSIRHKDIKKYPKENKIHRMTNDHNLKDEWYLNTKLSAKLPDTGRSRKESMQRQFGKKE